MVAYFQQNFDRIDLTITRWMAHHGLSLLRVTLGIVFFWFGFLKLFPNLSPAEELVRTSTFFLPSAFIYVLAVWETVIGIGLLLGRGMRLVLLLLFLQMPGTLLPLLIVPDQVWTVFPIGLTLEGQYIVKNLVLVASAIVLGATVRGGHLEIEAE